MNYGEILTKAWNTTWKHKVLWLFGILATFASGGGGGPSGGGGAGRTGINPNFDRWSYQINDWLQQNWWVIVLIAAAIFVLIILFAILGTFGRIGLIRGAWRVDEGQSKLTFSGLFSESGRYFWRVIGLALLVFAAALIITVVVGFGAVVGIALTVGIGLLCLIPFICILVLLGWLVEIIIRLTVVSIVGEDKGVFEALTGTWAVVRDHLVETIVMGLILGIGGAILGFIIAAPFFLAMIPLIGAAIAQTETALRKMGVVSIALVCLYLPIALFLSGVLQSYIWSAWTLTYRRMTGRESGQMEILPVKAAEDATPPEAAAGI